MLDEEMDHIIRDAADKHHPAYNDGAWTKMEKKLDKHLPQKNDRRRFLFFWLLFLLLGGGAYFGISYFNSGKNPAGKEIAENEKTGQLQTGNKEDQPLTPESTSANAAPADNAVENMPGANTVPAKEYTKDLPAENAASAGNNSKEMPDKNKATSIKPDPLKGITGTGSFIKTNSGPERKSREAVNTLKNKRSTVVKKGRSNRRISTPDTDDIPVKDEKKETMSKEPLQGKTADKMNITVTPAAPENNESGNKPAVQDETIKTEALMNKENIAGEQKNDALQKKDSVKADDPGSNREKKEKELAKAEVKKTSLPDKKKPKNNIAGNFGITFSAGPDLSFIELNRPGKAALNYGAGLSYNFGKRVTVRTGFYASKKIYSAGPEQYYRPPGSYYPGLYEVDAVCKVYEIPVSISYLFWQKKNHTWFGNAGLSSFLMKTEDYDYQYKTAYGTYTYKAAIRDRNKHYFAVLTLSAGYQYRFNKWLSLQAEPYVKLPLAGVGEGKVKLKSSGLLFTVTLKPFAKRN